MTKEYKLRFEKKYKKYYAEIKNKLKLKELPIEKIVFLEVKKREYENEINNCSKQASPSILEAIMFENGNDGVHWSWYWNITEGQKVIISSSDHDKYYKKNKNLMCDIQVLKALTLDYIIPEIHFYQTKYLSLINNSANHKVDMTKKKSESEKIRWLGDITQLIYCFKELEKKGLVNIISLAWIANNFVDKHGNKLESQKLSSQKSQLKNNKKVDGKPEKADKIDAIISKII